MKKFISIFAMLLSIIRLEAAEESVLSTSPDGAFELVQITELLPVKDKHKEKQRESIDFILRDTKTKVAVVLGDDGEDFINGGSVPSLQWSPTNSRLLIISAQIYKHARESRSVFRITDNSKLVYVPIPEDAIPDRWNSDGTVVLLIRHEDVYRFDGTKNVLEPVKSMKPGK